jgi:pimeloyl-ACP methyl ester carboxylesterase
MTHVTPFQIEIPPAALARIMQRVRDFEWPDAPAGGGWAYGAELTTMQDIHAYWRDQYDWPAQQARMNRLPQFMARPLDLDIHFIHLKSKSPQRRPLVISHGWPGSIVEFLEIIEPLARPEDFGGHLEDGFDVIAPSLPGYGFSQKPPKPLSPRTVARHFDALMTDILGYTDYLAQGGDWGSAISGWLGYEGRGCKAVHLNMMGWMSPGVTFDTPEEKAHQAKFQAGFEAEGAYFRMQSTKPLTLSYGMMDSPVGAAAWIIEKFKGWSDLDDGKLESVYTKDQLLTNVMVYLVTRTFGTASWMYRGLFEDPGGPPIPLKSRVEKPVAIARFPVDLIPFPPRSQVEKSLNVARWTEFARGGHFAAMERPQDLIRDIRAFGREVFG